MSDTQFRPGLEDVKAAKSAVSFIDGKRARLEYRGIPVDVLAKESCFEETTWLLLKGELPSQKQLADFDQDLRKRRAIHFRLKDLIKCMPANGHPMDALQASVAALGMYAPTRDVKGRCRQLGRDAAAGGRRADAGGRVCPGPGR
jgi:citrate synthase